MSSPSSSILSYSPTETPDERHVDSLEDVKREPTDDGLEHQNQDLATTSATSSDIQLVLQKMTHMEKMFSNFETRMEQRLDTIEKKQDRKLQEVSKSLEKSTEAMEKWYDFNNKYSEEYKEMITHCRASLGKCRDVIKDHEKRVEAEKIAHQLPQVPVRPIEFWPPPNWMGYNFRQAPPETRLVPPPTPPPIPPVLPFQASQAPPSDETARNREILRRTSSDCQPQNPTTQQSDSPLCIFCENSSHYTTQCRIYWNVEKRKALIARKNLCIKCLNPNDAPGKHFQCPQETISCVYCTGSHASIFCEAKELGGTKLCKFCLKPNHNTGECKIVLSLPSKELVNRLVKSKRCLQCFQQKNHKKCPKADRICQRCSQIYKDITNAQHHPLLCEARDAQKTAPVKSLKRINPHRPSNQRPPKQSSMNNPEISSPFDK